MGELNLFKPDIEKPVISATELCVFFGKVALNLAVAENSIKKGNTVSIPDGSLTFTLPKHKENRVTNIVLTEKPAEFKDPVITQELVFPSIDIFTKNYDVGRAIFNTHRYDSDGTKLSSTSLIATYIDLTDPRIQNFLSPIETKLENCI